MSKVPLRARALDAARQMCVFGADELPDLAEYAACNRQVQSMPTGMEKDEEMELHLQEAISAQQAANTGSASCSGLSVIPTPKVACHSVGYYDQMYRADYKQPRHLRKADVGLWSSLWERDVPAYDVDSDDERWLSEQNAAADSTPIGNTQFEYVMEKLEEVSERKVVTLNEARLLLDGEDAALVQNVYDYWLEKRTAAKQPLCPRVRTERRGVDALVACAPAVAAASSSSAALAAQATPTGSGALAGPNVPSAGLSPMLLEMVKRREITKRELTHGDEREFDLRVATSDWDGQVLAEARRNARSANKKTDQLALGGGNRKSRKTDPHGARKRKSSLLAQATDEDEGLVTKNWLSRNQDEWQRPLACPTSPPPLARRPYATGPSGRSMAPSFDDLSKPEMSELLDGRYLFKRQRGCYYHAPSVAGPSSADPCAQNSSSSLLSATHFAASTSCGGSAARLPSPAAPLSSQFMTLEDRLAPMPRADQSHLRHAHCYRTYLQSAADGPGQGRLRNVGYARRRVGRGGRVIFDRASGPPGVEYLDQAASSSAPVAAPTITGPLRASAAVSTANQQRVVYFRRRSPRIRPDQVGAWLADSGGGGGVACLPSSVDQVHRAALGDEVARAAANLLPYTARSAAGHLGGKGWDSGYSSPADARSQSRGRTVPLNGLVPVTVSTVANTLRSAKSDMSLNAHKPPLSPSAFLTSDAERTAERLERRQPVYATIRSAVGDVCSIPLSVGVSAELYGTHQRRVQAAYHLPERLAAPPPAKRPRLPRAADVSSELFPPLEKWQAIKAAGPVAVGLMAAAAAAEAAGAPAAQENGALEARAHNGPRQEPAAAQSPRPVNCQTGPSQTSDAVRARLSSPVDHAVAARLSASRVYIKDACNNLKAAHYVPNAGDPTTPLLTPSPSPNSPPPPNSRHSPAAQHVLKSLAADFQPYASSGKVIVPNSVGGRRRSSNGPSPPTVTYAGFDGTSPPSAVPTSNGDIEPVAHTIVR